MLRVGFHPHHEEDVTTIGLHKANTICLDVRNGHARWGDLRPGQFERAECSKMFSSLSDSEAMNTLQLIRTYMATGGNVQLSVPDVQEAISAYYRDDVEWFRSCESIRCGLESEQDTLNLLVGFMSAYIDEDGQEAWVRLDAFQRDQFIRMMHHTEEYTLSDLARYVWTKIPLTARRIKRQYAYDTTKVNRLLHGSGFRSIRNSKEKGLRVYYATANNDPHEIRMSF